MKKCLYLQVTNECTDHECRKAFLLKTMWILNKIPVIITPKQISLFCVQMLNYLINACMLCVPKWKISASDLKF